jgi:hypothetical protein
LSTLIRETETERDRYQATLHGFQPPQDELIQPGDPENGVAAEAIPEPPPTPTRAWLRGQQLAKERKARAAAIARNRDEHGRAG